MTTTYRYPRLIAAQIALGRSRAFLIALACASCIMGFGLAIALWEWAPDSAALAIWLVIAGLGFASLDVAEIVILQPWARVPLSLTLDDEGICLLGLRGAYRRIPWPGIEKLTECSPTLLLMPFSGYGSLAMARVDYRVPDADHFYVSGNLRGYAELVSTIRAHAPAQPRPEVRTFRPGKLYRILATSFAAGMCVLVVALITLGVHGGLGRPPITFGALAPMSGAVVVAITLVAVSYARTAYRLSFGPGWIEVRTGLRRRRFPDGDLIDLSPRGDTAAVLRWRSGRAYIYAPVFDSYCEIIEEINARLARQ